MFFYAAVGETLEPPQVVESNRERLRWIQHGVRCRRRWTAQWDPISPWKGGRSGFHVVDLAPGGQYDGCAAEQVASTPAGAGLRCATTALDRWRRRGRRHRDGRCSGERAPSGVRRRGAPGVVERLDGQIARVCVHAGGVEHRQGQGRPAQPHPLLPPLCSTICQHTTCQHTTCQLTAAEAVLHWDCSCKP